MLDYILMRSVMETVYYAFLGKLTRGLNLNFTKILATDPFPNLAQLFLLMIEVLSRNPNVFFLYKIVCNRGRDKFLFHIIYYFWLPSWITVKAKTNLQQPSI